MTTPSKPHSAEVLGDWRDDWWAGDYLRLLGQRLGLSSVRTAVDVGCGKGHWSRLVAPLLHPEHVLIGVDREPQWVDEAGRQAHGRGLSQMRFLQGEAEALPLDDASADLVTCQTVLMHLASPEQGLAEMLRVLRPGGWLLLSEPTNLAGSLLLDSVTSTFDPERLGRMVRFQAHMVKGRRALGEGDECIGSRLPQMLHAVGVHAVNVVQNERMLPVFAPPQTPGERRALGPYPQLVRERGWRFGEAHARRLYTAGGGPPEAFDRLFAEFLDQADTTVGQLEANTYWSAMGHNHYLVVGRKPLE